MNNVTLIGRLTRDPEVRYSDTGTAVGRFSLAIDRGKDKKGEDRGADFPSVVCFGKTAELVEKYVAKGRLVGVTGRLQTGSYEKDGHKVYTTDVVADRIEFLDWGDKSDVDSAREATSINAKPGPDDIGVQIDGFSQIDNDDIPF